MTIESIGASSALRTSLKATGISAVKASLVEDAVSTALATPRVSASKPDIAAVRDVIDKRIADDVAAGKLTREDAVAVTETLDDMQQKSAASTDAPAATPTSEASGGASAASGAAGGAHGGGGGGGGSAEKTELSRVVTVTGSLKTTLITYTDGTSETKTSANTGDTVKPADAARRIDPGAIIDTIA